MIFCKIKKLRDSAKLPEYKTEGAACMDIYADHNGYEMLTICHGETEAVGTGWSVEVPEGYVLEIVPRSGLALLSGITIPNSPGQVDSDYRGEVKVLLQNHSCYPFTIRRGDRIAQCRIVPVPKISWNLVLSLSETERGAGGFGSTGGTNG